MTSHRPPSRPTILVVDDEFGLAEMLRELLNELGFDVTLAINGRLALGVLRQTPIDVVLTDVMMPVMDGTELARALRSSAELRHIPIVFMTSLRSSVPKEPDLSEGVLEKPFTPDELLAALRTALEARR